LALPPIKTEILSGNARALVKSCVQIRQEIIHQKHLLHSCAAIIFKWHVFCLIGNSPAQWHDPLPARRPVSPKLHHQNCNIDIATAVVMIRILMAWWPCQL
jgi:hypothetical protein